MKFEDLSKSHLNQLLDFELENRKYFESLIAPRASDFYSEHGVAKHIQDQVENMNLGLAYSGVLVENGSIIGRGNLKEVSDGKALVGYRVSERCISQGFASYCLSQLVDIANTRLDIKLLEALVLDNNPASSRVLEKHDFLVVEYMPDFRIHDSVKYGCTRLRKTYS